MLNQLFNRPISPHLTIYVPQTFSLFSIWHRLSAAIIIGYIVVLVFSVKSYFWVPVSELHFFYQTIYTLWNSKLIKFYLCFVLLYHTINGLRHIKWDLGYVPQNKTWKVPIKLGEARFFMQALNNFKYVFKEK